MNIVETTPAEPKASEPAKYFHYPQNNSGGSFDIDDAVAHHVIIQARSASEANSIAKNLGIYFNGCDDDRDCHCCGDRWSEAWDTEGTDTPLIYGGDPATHEDIFTPVGEPVCHVYHLDGSKTTYRKAEGEKA
jgi:hypothetical protein